MNRAAAALLLLLAACSPERAGSAVADAADAAKATAKSAAKTLLAAAEPVASAARGAPEGIWSEDATRDFRHSAAGVRWGNPMGDWLDMDGKPLGSRPFATATATKGRDEVTVRLDVTDLVRAHGADFRINSIGGFANVSSREAATGRPQLLVTRGGTTQTLEAVADTEVNPYTSRPIGDRPLLSSRFGFLMRFDQSADPAVSRAVLVLTSPKRYGETRFLVFRPAALSEQLAVTPGATFADPQPAVLRTNPRHRAVLTAGLPASAHGGRPARTLLALKGSDLPPRPNARIEGDVYTGWFEGDEKTIASKAVRLPGGPTEAYLTVILKLGDDWKAVGGKLPGLSNTGLVDPEQTTCLVDGAAVGRGGWGGRAANGCRWSARTAYRRTADGRTWAGTYIYALSPKDTNGVVDWWSKPAPQGRWFAYVEFVRLNQPGKADGEVAYWLIDRESAPGGQMVQKAGGITYRSIDDPKSAINELWPDVYCGGRTCGPAPWPRYSMSLKRMEVTDALPDLAAIQAELDRLNGQR